MVATILRTSSSKRGEVGNGSSLSSTLSSALVLGGGGDDNSVTNKSTMTGNSTSSRSDNDVNGGSGGGGKRPKNVQFPIENDNIARIVCEIPNREEFTTDDIENLWFSKNDYAMNRQECQMISRDAIRYGYSKYLEDVYNEKNTDTIHKLQQWVISSTISPNMNCTSPMSAAPVVTGITVTSSSSSSSSSTLTTTTEADTTTSSSSTDAAATSPSPSPAAAAAATASSSTEISRRGLERWSNRDHGEVRKTEQFKAIMAVLEAQDEMLGSPTGKIDIDKLRKVSYKATKVARHFARMMGKVDSFAVLHLDDDPQSILFQHQHQLAQQQQADSNNTTSGNGKLLCDGTTTTTGPTSSSADSIITIDTAEFNEDDSLMSVISRVDEVELVSTKAKTTSPFSRFRFSSRRKLHNKNKVPVPTTASK